MLSLLSSLKLGAHKFSRRPSYLQFNDLCLNVQTLNGHDFSQPTEAFSLHYSSATPEIDGVGRLMPRRRGELSVSRIAQRPKCPANFPLDLFQQECNRGASSIPGLIVTKHDRLGSHELGDIKERDFGATDVSVMAIATHNQKGPLPLHDLYAAIKEIPFSLQEFYRVLAEKGHKIRTCELEVSTRWGGLCWVEDPGPKHLPQIHQQGSYNLGLAELAETLSDFASYCGDRGI